DEPGKSARSVGQRADRPSRGGPDATAPLAPDDLRAAHAAPSVEVVLPEEKPITGHDRAHVLGRGSGNRREPRRRDRRLLTIVVKAVEHELLLIGAWHDHPTRAVAVERDRAGVEAERRTDRIAHQVERRIETGESRGALGGALLFPRRAFLGPSHHDAVLEPRPVEPTSHRRGRTPANPEPPKPETRAPDPRRA